MKPMIPQGDPEERSAVDDAKEFLAGLLADGPMPAKRVYGEARDAGHSERTIRRAQKALGVEAIKEGLKGSWLWKLPVKMANKAEDGHTNCVDAFGNLGHLNQTYVDEPGHVGVQTDTGGGGNGHDLDDVADVSDGDLCQPSGDETGPP